MAVLTVDEHWPNRGGSFGAPTDSDVNRHFVVKTSDRYDTAFTVGASGMLPSYLSFHPANPLFTVRKTDIRPRADSPTIWDVVVSYSSKPLTEKERGEEAEENPLDRPARIRIRSQTGEKDIIRDRYGDVMQTTADEVLPSATIETTSWTVELEKNYYPLPSWAFECEDKLNSDELTIYGRTLDAETLKVGDVDISELQRQEIQVDEETTETVKFFTVRVTFKFRRGGWALPRANAGYQAYYLDDDATRLRQILVDDGAKHKVPPSSPQFLGEQGFLLDTPVDDSEVVVLEFDVYETMDFSVFPFDEAES